jgi:hypothetical protein
MAITKVLITVKTYPTLSSKYDELVCTAGFREDGSWIRIYPIPFRKLEYEKQYKKYQWIEIDLEKNTSDFRPESYKPSLEGGLNFKTLEEIKTDNNWQERKNIVLKKIYTNLSVLIEEAKDKNICTSLAVFKPKEILDFTIKSVERNWDKGKLENLKARAKQLNLFENSENPFEVVNKLPYKFSYKFLDENDKESTMMIEDWEIGALYWNCLRRHEGNEGKACEDVKKMYFDNFAKTKDLFLYLGTTREYHNIAPNPFVIIGTFHPKKEEPKEPSLFDFFGNS